MIDAGIIGVTGYVGSELLRIIKSHPEVRIKKITSQSYVSKKYNTIFENFRHDEDLICEEENIDELADECDVIFLALPHGVASKKVTKEILAKTKIIDLGADFRMKDANTYEEWYGIEHFGKGLLEEAIYGLSEINRHKIKSADLIANPGCHTTCGILSLYPLLKEGIIDEKTIIIDSKSGVSGAGRGVNLGVHFSETNENTKAYKVVSHRHTPEIEEQLSYAAGKSITLTFTPHLIPMNRGILATCYANLKEQLSYEEILSVYKKYYEDEFFVRICSETIFPETKWVKCSNFFDVGFTVDTRTNRIVVVGALDNLVKGAAGQAVQNMNIMFGLSERMGLENIAVFPA